MVMLFFANIWGFSAAMIQKLCCGAIFSCLGGESQRIFIINPALLPENTPIADLCLRQSQPSRSTRP
jgi:hypothetical protein